MEDKKNTSKDTWAKRMEKVRKELDAKRTPEFKKKLEEIKTRKLERTR